MSDKQPLLTHLSVFLADIGRSYTWFRDHAGKDGVPVLVKQQRSNFIVTEQGERYKRQLLRGSGVGVVGRPPRPKDDGDDTVAA